MDLKQRLPAFSPVNCMSADMHACEHVFGDSYVSASVMVGLDYVR